MSAATKQLSLAISYLRFSTPEQSKGDSVRRQTDLRDAWLTRNRVRLDTSLSLEDKGVSGFTGAHRDNPDRHALAALLRLVEAGKIAPGTYLIVESLDRLSREDIIPALTLVLNLIQAGVRIVQLLPSEVMYDKTANPMQVMMMIMELSRGHSESAMKSERVGGAWREKKRRAAANGEPLTARAPSWLRLVNGKWEVLDEAAETVRRIYRMATEGYGLGVITKKLNAEKASTISSGKRAASHWGRSYIAKLLDNRAVIGEYQPHTGRGGKRRPDGKPIAGYYPAIISEEKWYAARAALTSRRGKVGRLSKKHVNVFTGLLFDAKDGGSLQQVNKGKKSGSRILVSYKAVQGVVGSKFTSFPFDTFEQAVLSCLGEIDPREILPQEDRSEDKTLVLAGRLAEVDAEIEKVKTRLEAKYSDAVADVLDRHEAERNSLTEQLAAALQEDASPLSEAWKRCGSLLDAINAAPDEEEAHTRLRAALRRIVEEIRCLFVSRGSMRIAAVQVWFTGGAHRDYLILHRGATGGSVGVRPAQWWARSLAEVAPGDLDLRRDEDVKALETALATVELSGKGMAGSSKGKTQETLGRPAERRQKAKATRQPSRQRKIVARSSMT